MKNSFGYLQSKNSRLNTSRSEKNIIIEYHATTEKAGLVVFRHELARQLVFIQEEN